MALCATVETHLISLKWGCLITGNIPVFIKCYTIKWLYKVAEKQK